MLRELCRVVPEFYTHHWVLLKERKEPVLIVDIPEDFVNLLPKLSSEIPSLEKVQDTVSREVEHSLGVMNFEIIRQRVEILKQRLVNYVMKKHEEFMKANYYGDYDPKEKREWHALFKLHTISLDGAITLKPMPSLQKKETVNDYLQKNDIRKKSSKIIQEKLSQSLNDDLNFNEDSSTESTMPYLSQELIQKIKIKEKVMQDCSKDVDEKITLTEQNSKKEKLGKLAEILRTIFATQKSSLAPFEDIVGKLKDTDRGVYVSKGKYLVKVLEEVVRQIDCLREIIPSWIKYVESPQGRKIKLDKSTNLESILKLINLQ
jgi:hypothetical protein